MNVRIHANADPLQFLGKYVIAMEAGRQPIINQQRKYYFLCSFAADFDILSQMATALHMFLDSLGH